MDLVLLDANQPTGHIYRGGARIAAFRGLDGTRNDAPQDWIASTVAAYGRPSVGRTMLDSGRWLSDEIAADPVGWLGPDHVKQAGRDPKLLVKLLDAGQRLPVHVHPDDAFAQQIMGRSCGKTEAWFMLEPSTVHLGFNRHVGADELGGWVKSQDIDMILAAMNPVRVPVGASVVVPAGLPHAIGEGAFLVELQQPTDLSILMEWRDFAVADPDKSHLGLGFDVALQAVDRSAWDAERLETLVRRIVDDRLGVRDALSPAAHGFFRLQRIVSSAAEPIRLDAGYSVIIVLSGSAEVSCATGRSMSLTSSDTVLVAHRAGGLTVAGDAVLLRCRPPEL